MSSRIFALKSHLANAQGANRLSILQQLCALPAICGDEHEMAYLLEAEQLASTSQNPADEGKAEYWLGKHSLRQGAYEKAATYFEHALTFFDKKTDGEAIVDCKLALCEIEAKKANNTTARTMAEAALHLAAAHEYKAGAGAANNILGWINLAEGKYAGALQLHVLATTCYESIADLHGIALSRNSAGNAYRKMGQYENALNSQRAALHTFAAMGDKYRIASCHNNMSLNYIELGKYAEAMENQLKALEITKLINDRPGIAAAYGNIALIQWRQGNYSLSLDNQLNALKLQTEIGAKQAMAVSYLMIGNINLRQDNYAEALKAYHQSLEICEAIGDKPGAASAYNNIGKTYEYRGNIKDALDCLNKSLLLRSKLGNTSQLADLYNNMGNMHLKQGDCAQALERHFKALKIQRDLDNKPNVPYSLLNIGVTYYNLKDFVQSKSFLQEAIELATQIGQRDVIKDALFTLAGISREEKDFEKALAYYTQYHAVEKELTGQEMKEQINKLNIKNKVAHAEKEAEIERLRNVELKQALEQLTLEKARSEQLLGNQLFDLKSTALQAQMNPHFVFNSLNAIQNYIWKSNPEKATDYLASFAKLIRLVLENSRQPMVSLEKDLQALNYYVQLEALRFDNEFTYNITCDTAIDKEETMVPPMILQPYVENAIVHGLHPSTRNGELTVEIWRKDEDTLLITVEDNGVGRAKAAKEIVTAGAEAHQSLGLEVTEQRLKKVKGLKAGSVTITDLYTDENLPAGTLVEIELPV